MQLREVDAVILAGGLGTRIRNEIPIGTPKCLANINGRPFLAILMDHLLQVPFRSFTFCLGYGAEEVSLFLSRTYRVSWLREPTPLGTGGALRYVMRASSVMLPSLSNPFVVMNSDTYFGDLDFHGIMVEHERGRQLITSAKYDDKFVGVFAADWRMKDFLEWEHREKFDMADLPLHAHSKILKVNTPFLDIGTPEGLAQARMRFK